MDTNTQQATTNSLLSALTPAQFEAYEKARARYAKPLSPSEKADVEAATTFERDRRGVIKRRWRQK